MLAPSPGDGRLVNVTHLIPRSREDLERRRRAIELVAALSGGMMGRTPDYLNVTFACFAGRSDVWARRGNEAGSGQPGRLPGRDARPRPLDHPLDHEPAGRPQQARGRAGRRRGRAAQGRRDREPHHGARRPHAGDARAVRRRAHDLPGLGHPPPGRPLRALVRDPDGHARPQVHLPRLLLEAALARSTTRSRRASTRWTRWRSSTTSRCRRSRVFLDGDTVGYSEVITDTGWRGHIMHQAFTRAYVKLSFAFGLGHMIANTTGVGALRPHPGEARPDLEHGRADPLGDRRRPRPARRSTTAGSGIPTTARSWPCAARCRGGSRTATSCCS